MNYQLFSIYKWYVLKHVLKQEFIINIFRKVSNAVSRVHGCIMAVLPLQKCTV